MTGRPVLGATGYLQLAAEMPDASQNAGGPAIPRTVYQFQFTWQVSLSYSAPKRQGRTCERRLPFHIFFLVYGPGFLRARLLSDVVPNLGCGAVLAADRVAVDGGGGGHRRVTEAFADGRDVHALLQQEGRVAVTDGVERCPLGKLQQPAKPGHRSRHRIRPQGCPVRIGD